MALANWTYWALVGATLSTAAFRMTAVWMLSRWRPQGPARRSGTRPLVRFGADLTLVGVVYALSRGCDSLLIGRYLGSDAVGLYSRATALLTRPLERVMAPVYTVIVPALSRLQSEPDRYRRAFVRAFEGLAIAAFFLGGLLFPLASLLVRVILGDKWHAAAPIFAALTFALVYLPLAAGASWLCTSQGTRKGSFGECLCRRRSDDLRLPNRPTIWDHWRRDRIFQFKFAGGTSGDVLHGWSKRTCGYS